MATFAATLAELKRLERSLPQKQLNQFVVFNKAYLIVTVTIQQAALDGYFQHPKFIEKFSACFASYYFTAIKDNNSPKLAPAWTLLNQAGKHKTPNFVLLLMGANAHINHDLPLTLVEMLDDTKLNGLVKDVLKIDKLLMRCGRDILDTFDEPNKLLNWLKRHAAFLYYRPAMYMILYWRFRAWHNYMLIKKHGLKDSNYTRYSIRVAKRFRIFWRRK